MTGTFDFPDGLFYDAGRTLWFKEEGGGVFRMGITAQGAKMVGDLVACVPRPVGAVVEAERAVATIESGKWVGAVRLPFAATVIESNEALIDRPATVNRDPFGAGWLAAVRAENPVATRALLASGRAGDAHPLKD